jgi:hypothetical protein
MKKILGVVIAVAMVMGCFAGFGVSAEGGGDELELLVLPGGFFVYRNDPSSLWWYGGEEKDVVVPESITDIGWGAFTSDYITSVSIHSGVRYLTGGCFYECFSLEEINVSSDNANYSSDDGVLFNEDKTMLIRYPSGKVGSTYEIPSSVKIIGNRAFSDSVSLIEMNIPSSVTTIENSAFAYCASLASVSIPSGVTTIKSQAFFECPLLVSVSIPSSVTIIESSAFAYCVALASVDIPNSVTEINVGAFAETTVLTVFAGSYAHQWCIDNEQPYVIALISSFDSIQDVFSIMKIIVSSMDISEAQIDVADFDEDGDVDAMDALMALKYVLGL